VTVKKNRTGRTQRVRGGKNERTSPNKANAADAKKCAAEISNVNKNSRCLPLRNKIRSIKCTIAELIMNPMPETSDKIVMRPASVSDLQIQGVKKFDSDRRF